MSVFLDLGIPALLGTLLFATLPLIDPSVRWTRRLKNDIQIAAGLPEGPERRLWNSGVEAKARNLREYQEAFGARLTLLRYAAFAYGLAAVGYLIWPTGWNMWMQVNGVPGIPLALIVGLTSLNFLRSVARGTSFNNESPAEILRARRNKPHHKRLRKVYKLDKKRRLAIKAGRNLKPAGTRLGFEPWMLCKDELRPADCKKHRFNDI